MRNHPFFDGNKRTGYTLVELMLIEYGYEVNASEDEKYDFVIAVVEGRLAFDDIKAWIEAHT